MNKIEFDKIVTKELIGDAILNNEFIGFKEDYSVIHCLLKKWEPKSIFEIGTCTGMGCKVMENASPKSKIITLDINVCGGLCSEKIKKIVGDSMTFNYSDFYPIDCWFIDGNHVYENAYHETTEAIKANSKYIIYHDADIDEVYKGILDAFKDSGYYENYDLFQVINPPFIYSSSKKNTTRVAYAIKK